MSRKVISFLGATNYSETTYAFNGQTYASKYMAAASRRFADAEKVYIFATKEAQAKHVHPEGLGVYLQDDQYQIVDIPEGRSETELWEIFNAVAGVIHDGDEVVFDVTNSLRSIPIFALMAASFAKTVKKATVKHILYGVFEFRSSKTNTAADVTPVFDLLPFEHLLQWTTATDAFVKYGRGEDLTALMRDTPGYARLADTLGQLTAALQTSRPSETLQTAHQLQQEIAQLRRDETPAQRPIGLLLDQISHEYGKLAHPTPTTTERELMREVLLKHYEMFEWYCDHRLYVQAATLIREWMVSYVIVQSGVGTIFHKGSRDRVEQGLRKEPPKNFQQNYPELYALTHQADIQATWISVRVLRNDLGHVGMSLADSGTNQILHLASEIEAKIDGIRNEIRALVQAL